MDNLWIWLVVEPYPSEKYESIGMMTFPMEKLKIITNQTKHKEKRNKAWETHH